MWNKCVYRLNIGIYRLSFSQINCIYTHINGRYTWICVEPYHSVKSFMMFCLVRKRRKKKYIDSLTIIMTKNDSISCLSYFVLCVRVYMLVLLLSTFCKITNKWDLMNRKMKEESFSLRLLCTRCHCFYL